MLSVSRAKRISKFLSLVLRHKPEVIGIDLDANGWVKVNDLIRKSKPKCAFTFDELREVVETNDKQRFDLDLQKNRIRANQGHSVDVDVELEAAEPPEFLYHGTISKNLNSIFKNGLIPQSRQYVHMSSDLDTAVKVGNRYRGNTIILKVAAQQAYGDGVRFLISKNGVWLAKNVDPKYLSLS